MGDDLQIIAANLFPFLIGAAIQFHLRPAGGSSELHFGRLDTAWYGNCSGLHIYIDIGKLVIRKPDDRAPAYSSTMIVENWYSVSRLTVLRRHEG